MKTKLQRKKNKLKRKEKRLAKKKFNNIFWNLITFQWDKLLK